MKASEAREQFKALYFTALRTRLDDPKNTEYKWPDTSDAAVHKCVDRMLAAAQVGNISLGGNPALKWVAKKLGATTIGGLAKLLTEDAEGDGLDCLREMFKL